jgi:WS/DGAT/MGAT family acyltransferase
MSTQLGAQDAQFLYLQTGEVLTHVMSINLYDPATAPGGKVRYPDIVRHIADRCHLSPIYRRRLYRLPGDLDFPYWVEDPDFKVEKHMSRVRLPKPGDWRQFCRLAARHFARPMDLERPLWDIVVVEGLDRIPGIAPGSYALLQRFHHAAIDGASGAYALAALCDRDAQGTPAVDTSVADAELGSIPTPATMVSRALASNLASPIRMIDAVMKLSPALVNAARKRLTEGAATDGSGVPVTRFNERVSLLRTFEAVEFQLQDLRAIRALVEGATVNDVILAIASGALRKYLDQHGELPEQTLVAIAPINARKRGGGREVSGNDVSAMTIPLATQIADPVARMKAIRVCTQAAKEAKGGLGARMLADLSRRIPGLALAGVARLMTNERFARSQANLIITNVPGSPIPLYMTGARLTHQFGMGPVTHGMGLFISANSYDRAISFCLTADRRQIPDIELLGRCIRDSFDELKRATGKRGKQRVANRKKAPRAHRAKQPL